MKYIEEAQMYTIVCNSDSGECQVFYTDSIYIHNLQFAGRWK